MTVKLVEKPWHSQSNRFVEQSVSPYFEFRNVVSLQNDWIQHVRFDNKCIQILAYMSIAISKKKKFVSDGVFYAELNEFFARELAAEGFAGVEIRVTADKTEIIIKATKSQ